MIQHDIKRALAAMPVSLDPKFSIATKQLYEPLLVHANEGVMAERDIAYGPHERHKLDVFHVPGTNPSAILIYVPGGGFTGGDKRSFGHLGGYFARRGILGITMNYRLSPEIAWPAGAQDVAAAVAWAKANAATYGADASRIVVFGHSAGASHAVSFLFDPEIHGDRQVAGGILVSGAAYALPPDMSVTAPNIQAYFGTDNAQVARRSAISHVAGTKVPVMLAVAELDPGLLITPTLALAAALTIRDNRCPPLYRLEGHNHFSPPCSFGTSDDELGSACIRFIMGLQTV